MAVVHPTRVARLNIMVVLLGVALPFSIQQASTDFSWQKLVIVIAYLVTSLNFLHGKVVAAEDENLTLVLRANPRAALYEFVLNICIVITFVFIASTIEHPEVLILLNILLRALDSALVSYVRGLIPVDGLLCRAQTIWLRINLVTLALWGLTCLVVWPIKGEPSSLAHYYIHTHPLTDVAVVFF